MNSIDNPLTQIMQAFGTMPAGAPFGIYGADMSAGTSNADIAAHFSGYIEGTPAQVDAALSASFAGLAKNHVDITHSVQADADLAIDPSVVSAPTPITFNALSGSSSIHENVLNGENQLDPETAAAYSLATNYHSAKPIALSSDDLKALQSAAPAPYASLSAAQPKTDPFGLNGITSLPQLESVSGQFLPTSDLKALIGSASNIIGSQTDSQPISSPKVNTLISGIEGTITQAQTNGATNAQAATLSGSVSPHTELAGTVNNGLPTFKNNADVSLTNLQDSAVVAKIQTHSAEQDGQKSAEQTIVSKLDADGQILTVSQKARAANSAQALAKNSTSGAPGTTSGLQTTMAAAGVVAAPASSSKNTEKTTNSLANDALKTKAPETSPGLPTNMAHAGQRGSFDWTSPWITPEKATGWSDSFAASLVSSGLGGMMGNQSGITGMSMLGGQPSPSFSGHVTKQLNLHMTRAIKAGEQEFSMRMDPPELGRVSVKLKFGQNGLVRSQIMAERPETLEMLQREIRGLERAIEAGGHKAEQGGISFSLDSSGQESAGKAFAEAMQQDRLREEMKSGTADQDEFTSDADDLEETPINLDEILANVTPETGLDVRV